MALYDRLMRLAPSPVVALNRAIAIGERDGADRGLEELESIAGAERLASYPFHRAAMGELELRRGNAVRAREHFTAALGLARNAAERRFFERRLLELLLTDYPLLSPDIEGEVLEDECSGGTAARASGSASPTASPVFASPSCWSR